MIASIDVEIIQIMIRLEEMKKEILALPVHPWSLSDNQNPSFPLIESGTAPAPGGGSQTQPTFTATYSVAETEDKKHDCYLCTDLLATEKHASHLYDTCIFEFKQESVRNALNHIQKEEQNHGKMIYDYMSANSMYS